jgi:FkbM family methyltransferase
MSTPLLFASIPMSEGPRSPDAGDVLVRKSLAGSRRSPRLALLEAAFTNWRVPGYLGSIAYRARRFSPGIFRALMNIRVEVKTRQGPAMLVRLRDINGPAEVFGLDEYATQWLDWARVEYVLDAGAHVGGFTLWVAARSQCRILALEPNPATRDLLEANVHRARLAERVAVRPWALAGVHGARRLLPADDSAASALVRERADDDVEVDAVSLAEAIAASAFPRVDVVKMDIEGTEYEVFAAASRDAIRSVAFWIVECHQVEGATAGTIAEVLGSAGFEVTTLPKPLGLVLLIARRRD